MRPDCGQIVAKSSSPKVVDDSLNFLVISTTIMISQNNLLSLRSLLIELQQLPIRFNDLCHESEIIRQSSQPAALSGDILVMSNSW